MSLITRIQTLFTSTKADSAGQQQPLSQTNNTGTGTTSNYQTAIKNLYQRFNCDPELAAAIHDIRHMDKQDQRVKKIHKRMARDATKGGVRLIFTGNDSPRIKRQFDTFVQRLNLNDRNKLKSDARGLVMEGNLALQWVIDNHMNVVAGLRMPTETLVPLVNTNGTFKDPRKAYKQINPLDHTVAAHFALWQLTVSRLDPDNFDDAGSLGRPYLDASRTVWQKLVMTEEDLVIRRRTRAPQRFSHVLEGADKSDLDLYRADIETDITSITTDFYSNKKGGVTALGGDANLDQIADVAHLLDTFFAGAPAPKGLFGYVNDLARDVLEDLKADYYEEIDELQDALAHAYEQGFRLQLLLQGINPNSVDFCLQMAERKTESRNQRADLALKYQALTIPDQIIVETLGMDYARVVALRAKQREQERNTRDVYPEISPPLPGTERTESTEETDDHKAKPTISITPGNAPKGESATSITNQTNRTNRTNSTNGGA